jgi:hypothetical protein
MYSIEKRGQEEHILITTPARATWYTLQGYEVFDFTESLEMEPEYLETKCERNLITSSGNSKYTQAVLTRSKSLKLHAKKA